MAFRLDNCAALSIKRGNIVCCDGIDLPIGSIRGPPIDSSYKHLGVLDAGGFQHSDVKANVRDEYKKRLRLLLKSKSNSQNQIQAINRFAVPVVRYTAGIIDWALQECGELHIFTRKQMTLFKALRPCAGVDRLYASHKNGGGDFLSVADVVQIEKYCLSLYINKSKDLIRGR